MPRTNGRKGKHGKQQFHSVTTTFEDRKHDKKKIKTPVAQPIDTVSTATLLITYNQTFKRNPFENWLKDSARKEGKNISIKSVDFFSTTHTIRLVVDMADVQLINKICDDGLYQGQKLQPRIQSVDNVESAASKQRRMEQAFMPLIQERFNGVTLNLADVGGLIEWSNVDAGRALCTSLKHFCTGCRELILDKNGLSNLSLFNGIARSCPTIEALSIQQNNIREFTQLKMINNLRLRSLNIAGNPISAVDAKTRMDEAKKYFPRLELLDGKQTKPMRFIDPNMLVDGFPLCELPHVNNGLIPPELMDLAQFFVGNVLPKLANRDTPENDLAMFYEQDAYLSISLSPELGPKHVQITPFARVNRNLIRNSTTKVVTENLYHGPLLIAKAIKSLPVVSVIPSTLVCDAIDISPFSKLPEMQGKKAQFVQLAFCGSAMVGGDQGEKYSFRRVFVILMSPQGMAIRNDMLTLLPELGKNVALDSAHAMNASNEEVLIDKVVAATNIKRSYAREILTKCQGNPDTAIQMITQARGRGEIPNDYFS